MILSSFFLDSERTFEADSPKECTDDGFPQNCSPISAIFASALAQTGVVALLSKYIIPDNTARYLNMKAFTVSVKSPRCVSYADSLAE